MNKKDKITYAAIIAALVIILSVLWFLIIDTVNSNYTVSGGNVPAMNGGGSSSASYSAVKEITSDEDVTSGEFSSSNADENAISVSGDITATLSGITVTKTGDSDGGDNTSFMALTQRLSLRVVRI